MIPALVDLARNSKFVMAHSFNAMLEVSVAIILDDQRRVLISQRALHKPHGGYFEFPGGKIEANESPEQALIREMVEELGIDLTNFKYLSSILHDYHDKQVKLHIFLISKYKGQPRCCDGQIALEWKAIEDLQDLKFPEANFKIIDLILKVI